MTPPKSEPGQKPATYSKTSPLRVALVEDRPDVQESWTQLINAFPDIKCVCACNSGEQALRVIPSAKPQVVLMDIFMPGMTGIECTAQLKEFSPTTPILILTSSDDDELVFQALQSGADGYLLKRTKPTELRAALFDAVSGGAPMSSEIARRVVASFRTKRPAQTGKAVSLTERETEILEFLTQGFANKEIADKLDMAVETVRSHLKHIYEKMHVRSRGEAVYRFKSDRNTP